MYVLYISNFKWEVVFLIAKYVITNPNKKIFIRIGEEGKPETCIKNCRQLFTYDKANNILKSLPKTMKKFHFKIEKVSHVEKDKEGENEDKSNVTCIVKPYIIPIEVQNWLDRIKGCNGLAKEAEERKKELVHQLSNVDKELSNCLHEIELFKNMNACDGYKEYKRTKNILEKRRIIKDELSVVNSILSCNLQSIATDRIQKVVDGLGKRKFRIREVELDNYIEGDLI